MHLWAFAQVAGYSLREVVVLSIIFLINTKVKNITSLYTNEHQDYLSFLHLLVVVEVLN